MTRRVLVAHASNLLARGFLTSASDRMAENGQPTNALFAVARALLRALAFKEPEFAVAVIDAEPNDASPPLLKQQAERLAEVFTIHGMRVVRASNPADVVASYTRAALDDGCDVVVVGSDKRLAQLVSDEVWWYDAYKDVRYTPELVRKRFEVGPENVAEWLALVGDDDTLPGVKGIGKKGATTLIESHGSVAAALADVDAIAGRTGKALRAAGDATPRELERALLNQSADLPAALADLAYRPLEHDRVQEFYREYGFFELLSTDGQEELAVDVCDTTELVDAALAGFDGGPVSIMALTDDPSAIRGRFAGLALAQAGRIVYVPFAGKGASLSDVPAKLEAFLADPKRALIGHDTKDAVIAFARLGVTVAGIVGDSVCGSHLAQPSNWAPHDLSLVARYVLRMALPEDDTVRGVGKRRKQWSALAVDQAAAYAGRLADTAEKAWAALESTTDAELLAEYLTLSQTLVRMELAGIACDATDLAQAGEDFERIGSGLEAQIFEMAGKEFNLGSTKQLGAVLFEQLGLPIVKRTKTGWSTANEALERIENAHPIVPLVIRWRRLRRLKDNWVTALTASIDSDGRVRSTFHPARSFSGRLVNSAPDLGRVPGRTPEMARIRHAFHAPAGSTLLSVDYRQLGLYVLAHLSEDPALVDSLANEQDMHRLTAAAVLEKAPEEISKDERQLGKVINFATFAGQGASSLAMQLGATAKEAKLWIERFYGRYSAVRSFQDEQLRLAQERGYIQTIAGRHWPIGSLRSPDQTDRSYAERLARRATHEGSVADVSRRGLLRADQALREAGLRATPLLQVHDEVLFEVVDEELTAAAEIAAAAMRNAFELRVPLRVGCKAGPNWAELVPLTLPDAH